MHTHLTETMLKFSYSSRWTTRTDRGVPISSRSVIVPAELELSTDFESALSTSFFKRPPRERPAGRVRDVGARHAAETERRN